MMLFTRSKSLIDDLTVPGTTVLIGEKEQVKELGLNNGESEIILFPHPTDSPNDPLNWSMARKNVHFSILFLYAIIFAAISNFTGPIYSLLAEIFQRSLNDLNTGSALQLLFLALSCLFCQPIANKFGRRAVYLVTTLFVIISCVIFVTKRTYGGIIGYFILCGIGVGPMDSLIQVSITDIFFLHEHGKYIGIYSVALGAGSALGPFIAGYATSNLGYLWCGYLSIIIAGVLLIVEFFFLEESNFKRDFTQREINEKLLAVVSSNRLHSGTTGTATGNIDLITDEKNKVVCVESSSVNDEPEIDMTPKSYLQRLALFQTYPNKLNFTTFWKVLLVLRYPSVAWAAILYGLQICWLSLITVTQSQFFLGPPYNFSEKSLGLLNLAMLVGSIIGSMYISMSDHVQMYFTKRNNGIFEPEFRLHMFALLLVSNVAGILMYGLGPYYGVCWVVGAIGIALISISLGGISGLSMNYVLECYPKQASETMTAILFVRNIIAMVFTFVFQYWLDGVGVPGTTAMLAAFCVFFNGTYVIMYCRGKNFRKWTQKWYEAA